MFLHDRDLTVPVLIHTIKRLTKKKVQMASEVSSMLWNRVAERASAKEEANILHAEPNSRTQKLETEKNELQSVLEKELDRRSSDWPLKLEKYQIEQHRLRERTREIAEKNVSLQREVSLFNEKQEKVKELKLETLLTTVLREKLYSEEIDIKQLQADLAATVRINDILKCKVQNTLDALSYATPKLKYLELQVRRQCAKKDENINHLTNDLQECMKELGIMKAILLKVFQERDFMWKEVKSYSEMNMLLNYEINMLKMHQNSAYSAAENVGSATKPNGIMHKPVLSDRHNAFSNNSSSVLFCIQTTVDIPSQISVPSTFELPDHALVGPGHEGLHLGLLYVGSLVVLLVYSILYSLTANESFWLRATTSAAVIILGWNLGSCLYGFTLLKSRVVILFVADTSWVFLICFGVHYWYFGQCISYAVVVSVLLEGFRRKYPNSSASSSERCGSSVKRSSSSDDGHLGNATVPCNSDGNTYNNIEGINSDKSIDSRRPSLDLCNSSCPSVVKSLNGLRRQGEDSSTSTSANQQILNLNLALAFQEKLSNPRITSILKRKGRHTDRELANFLQDKGLDPNFAVMLKENGLDPMILDLLQRSITTKRLLERPNGEFLMKSSSEATTTQDAAVYVVSQLLTGEDYPPNSNEEYIRDLESGEEEQRKLWMEELKKAERKNCDEFRKLMEEHVGTGILNAKTNWRDYCIKFSLSFLCPIKDFASYLAISSNTSGSTAKDLFTDVMDELDKQIVLTLAWTLDDFEVANIKYISSPPMSDTNLKGQVLNKISGLSAEVITLKLKLS
ncbi:Calpain-type cysteine protease ADL1 [Capsicum baccatum]|uniref:Calpain-type cysteine protease ADL1 n=1 Tax=Capsicum baccatum TaxID=33114 RepID=A0A2G2V9A4_CAPBA|nr:Calpain-type cysteine protease ADL1 [Capsicum baccatum]